MIKWGIIGTGSIANKFAAAVLNAEGANLAAVASRNIGTANAFADKYGIKHRFGSYEDLAAFEGVDAVYIATPHTLHYSCTKICLEAKKNVLCEKPMAVNYNQACEMTEIADKNGVFLMEAMWTRFLPAIRELKKVVDGGVIGKIRSITADFCYDMSENKEHNVFNPEYAGGSLLDVGVYAINFAAIFLGADYVDMKCMAEVAGGVDEQCYILFSTKSGAVASLSSALTANKPSDAYIYGSEGYIHVPQFFKAQGFTVFPHGGEAVLHNYPYIGNGFEEEIIECGRCILAGKAQSDIMPWSETEKIVRVMDEARLQAGVVYPTDVF